MIRKILLVMSGVFALVALVAAPASAQYPDITVSPGTVGPGGTVTVTGQGCSPGEPVTISLRPSAEDADRAIPAAGAVVATTTADENGDFSADFVIPADAQPGSYDVVVECGGITRVAGLVLVADDATPPPSTPAPTDPGGQGSNNGGSGSGNLPGTGSNLNGYGLLGAGLLTIGGLFLLGARNRRSAA